MFQNESDIDIFNVTVINSNATRFAGSSRSSSSQQMSDVTRAQQAINVQSVYAMPSVSILKINRRLDVRIRRLIIYNSHECYALNV
jgi:hypothetical protein